MITKIKWKEPDGLIKWKKDHKDLNDLIEERITNFLGYGDPGNSKNRKIWFIGMEEGASENAKKFYPDEIIDKDEIKECPYEYLKEYYITWFEKRRENIKQGTDKAFGDQKTGTEYGDFWKNKFYRLYRLLLFLKKEKKDGEFNNNKSSEEILEMKQITDNLHKETCLLEFNPIPFRKPSTKKNASPFEKKGTFLWEEYVKHYGQHNPLGKFIDYISKRRKELIKEKIKKYHPKIVILYGLSYKKCYLDKELWGKDGSGKLDEKFKEENIADYRKGKGYNLYHSTITNKDNETGEDYKTHIFIIPHCSDPSANKYPEIGARILEIIATPTTP